MKIFPNIQLWISFMKIYLMQYIVVCKKVYFALVKLEVAFRFEMKEIWLLNLEHVQNNLFFRGVKVFC